METDDDNTRTHVALSKGTMVLHYRIVEKIGAGGMGEVYLAEDTELDRKVALKFLPSYLCRDDDCRKRFKREAQAAAKLGHANIVAVHEVGEHQGRPFFAMELVEGRPLDKVVASGRLSQDEIVELALGICNGLRKAHEWGVIHRDIKPSNIIVDRDNVPRVLDFGLAVVRDSARLTQTGSTLGTIGYMSPEQIAGRDADARSDLFSLGVVLYELTSGLNPFMRDNQAATLKAISEDTPEPLARRRTDISEELQRIVGKLLEKKPELRFQTAADLGADLRRMISSTPVVKHRARARWYVAAIIAIVTVGTLGIIYVLRNKPAPESGRKMLAVLPFENLSPDPDQEYFSDGLTEELTSNLSQIQSLCVISRSSAMTFKGSNKTVPEIAKALKVQYVVEGSVRRAGKELRISAQLIDANTDTHLWSRTYTGTLADIFDMQDSVSRAIVDGIKIQLTPDESRRLSKRPFGDARAYEFYLRGNSEIDIGTPEAIKRGLAYFEQGLAVVGDNPLIYSGLAWAYWSLVNSGLEQEAGISKSLDCAQKALTLDPESADAHAVLGWINAGFLGDEKQAMFHYKNALAIDSSNELALKGVSLSCYVYLGKASAARPIHDRYIRLYPLDSLAPLRQQSDEYLWSGYFLKALEPFRESRQRGDRSPFAAFLYAMVLSSCDSISQAVSVIDSCEQAYPTDIGAAFCRMLKCALYLDKTGALQQLTPEVRLTCRRDAQWSFHVGELLARAGAKEEAFDWLENAANRGFINYPFWQIDPFLNSIRGEARFKKLMELVKYEWDHFEI